MTLSVTAAPTSAALPSLLAIGGPAPAPGVTAFAAVLVGAVDGGAEQNARPLFAGKDGSDRQDDAADGSDLPFAAPALPDPAFAWLPVPATPTPVAATVPTAVTGSSPSIAKLGSPAALPVPPAVQTPSVPFSTAIAVPTDRTTETTEETPLFGRVTTPTGQTQTPTVVGTATVVGTTVAEASSQTAPVILLHSATREPASDSVVGSALSPSTTVHAAMPKSLPTPLRFAGLETPAPASAQPSVVIANGAEQADTSPLPTPNPIATPIQAEATSQTPTLRSDPQPSPQAGTDTIASADARTFDHPRRTDPAAPQPVPVALPAAAERAPVAAGTTASAYQLFGVQRAARPRDEQPGATLGPAAASAPIATHRAEIPATVEAQQAPLDMADRRWPHAMIDRIEALRDAADASDTRIRLVPDALGQIDVSVRREGDTVHVHFAAEQAATRTLIQDAQPRLADIAQQRGLSLGQTSVGANGDGAGNQAQRQPAAPVIPTAPTRAETPDTDSAADGRLA